MNAELKHYGIKGMRWGVRRFQNKDGSLTNAGKLRYKYQTEEGVSEKDAGKAAKYVDRETKRYDKMISRMKKSKSVGKSAVEKMINKRNKIANMPYDQARREMSRQTRVWLSSFIDSPMGSLRYSAFVNLVNEYERSKM